jgi:hypothetical protein
MEKCDEINVEIIETKLSEEVIGNDIVDLALCRKKVVETSFRKILQPKDNY